MSRFPDRQLMPDRGPRLNEQIRISPIRLIGPAGEQLGVVPTSQALEQARAAGLDLVEVAATERPPVCKILDYGKMRFANSHKNNKTTKVRQQKLKEIRLRPKTDEHDIETKANQARRFLEHNDKVQVTLTFRGREMQHQQEGRRVLDAIVAKLADIGKIERAPMMDGKKMTAMLMPLKAPTKPPKPPKVPKTPPLPLHAILPPGGAASPAGAAPPAGAASPAAAPQAATPPAKSADAPSK